ncbi:MAG TPA: tetratricopeptide repeat protein [Bacteroidota bacterium]|nr:tetratricopeptide repeat protein [Bacteroidota bacterium]
MKALFLAFVLAWCSALLAQTQDDVNKVRLAKNFEQAGEFDQARLVYEELARADSTSYVYFDGLRRCYEQLKNYDAAIALNLRWLKRQPNDLNLLASLGTLYYKSGSEARADSAWNAAIAAAPKSAMSYTIVSLAQSDNRLFEKSIGTYLRGRKEIGEPTLFVGEMAMLYSLMMNYGEATREYMTMLSLNEHELELVESRLSGFTAKGEGLAAATTVVEEAAARDSRNVVVRRLLLWLYMEGKRFYKALEIAKEIDALTHSNGVEVMSFAGLAFKEKAYDAAAMAYRSFVENYRATAQTPNAMFGYARAMEELGPAADTLNDLRSVPGALLSESHPGYQGAMELYLSLSRDYPHTEVSVQALYRAAMMHFERYFDLDAAEAILDSLLMLPQAQKMSPAILSATGAVKVAQGKLAEASHRYAIAAASPYALPEEKTRARFALAEIQFFQAQFDSASSLLRDIAQALSDDESNDALRLLHFIKENQTGSGPALKEYAHAALLDRRKKYSEEIASLSSIVQTFPDAPLAENALLKKAELSVVVGQPNDALASYEKLLSDYPKSIMRDKAQFGIGELYQFQLKDKEKAIHAYEQLLALFPNSLLVEQARKRIRGLRGDVL